MGMAMAVAPNVASRTASARPTEAVVTAPVRSTQIDTGFPRAACQ